MSDEERRKHTAICDLCNNSGASEIIGGIYGEHRGIFLVCKECKTKINDERKLK